MNVSEIREKYCIDGFPGMGCGPVTVTVDLEAMRAQAKDTLREAEQMVNNRKDALKRRANVEPAMQAENDEWTARWLKRQKDNAVEIRRNVEMAKKMLDGISEIIDAAEKKLGEVK